jgi:hypothetical protein
MLEPAFLTLEDILFIHHQEIRAAGGEPSIRDREGIKACVDAQKPVLEVNFSTIYSKWLQATLLA